MQRRMPAGVAALLLSALCVAQSAAGQVGQRSGDPQYPSTVTQPRQQAATADTTSLDENWTGDQNPFKPGNRIRSSEIKCSVLEWDDSSPKPMLTVVCPPRQVFSPLRVFLKFSWADAKDVPKDAANILAAPKTETKILLGKGNIKVSLRVSKTGDTDTREKWVVFNALQAFAIVPTEAMNARQ